MPMLDVKKNRLDYGRLLMPPEGHKLTQAVATTYSVDLDTLLSIPVALYYAQTLEGELQGKDVQLIRAIQQTARLLTIYHQKGQLRVPRTAKDIYAYFEESMVPILPDDAFKSFHPKTWVLRYENNENPDDITYRLIVLSRNLTFDRSWDVAAHLEGKLGDRVLERNKPLVDFHAWLHSQSSLKDGSIFLAELARVEFENPEAFDDYEFHPIGIPGYKANPTATCKSEKSLCLSPFLHRDALGTLRRNVEEAPILLGRRIELERLRPETIAQFKCYCLSETVVDGERLASGEEGDGEPQEQDLHAKVFLFDDRAETTWFLGSANATLAAFEKNVEFMLELKGTQPAVRLSKVRKLLLGNDEAGELFVPFQPSEAEEEIDEAKNHRNAIRRLEYALLEAEMRGCVTQSENGTNFDLALLIDLGRADGTSGFSVRVRPFARDVGDQPLVFGTLNRLLYPNISETSLSRFLHFTLSEGDEVLREFLVRIDVTGIPTTRLDNIFKNIINSRDKFFSYLRFLLTGELSKEDLEDDPPEKKSKKGQGDGAGWEFDMPIYEQLLVTASRNPGRMQEVDRVIASLHESNGESVVPDDFLSLWEVFKAAVPQAEGSHESS
jgi:hypothetical protein